MLLTLMSQNGLLSISTFELHFIIVSPYKLFRNWLITVSHSSVLMLMFDCFSSGWGVVWTRWWAKIQTGLWWWARPSPCWRPRGPSRPAWASCWQSEEEGGVHHPSLQPGQQVEHTGPQPGQWRPAEWPGGGDLCVQLDHGTAGGEVQGGERRRLRMVRGIILYWSQ